MNTENKPKGREHDTATRAAGADAPTPPPVAAAKHPEWIGAYRILQVLGEGGMGVVYMAEQREPVRRRVALKIMKAGLDTKQVVGRFETERQALAVMDHPGIAKVFDGAVADNGLPYFVMELVQGIPITDYCDLNRLTTRERVELFIGVCHAVQHAHQKGVIHRDLKPSNVLVMMQDGKAQPKVIDFGIAKATERRLSDATLVTQIGQVLGTPAFMSPEQYELTGLDIDTRTDIYSLGVMLYFLLTGAYPFDPRLLARAGSEGHKILRETDAATPSSRLATTDERSTQIAAQRHTDPGSLSRQVKGDLDWITLKAMSRERAERYETANAFALDLRRHLNNEPVTARPPTTTYRMSRFVRRHRAGVAFAAVLSLLVVGSAFTAAVQARRIARERDRAEVEMAKATAMNAFLQEMLRSADPSQTGQRNITVLEALQDSSRKIDSSFGAQPLLAAAARRTIGRTYASLGRYQEAEPLLRKALAEEKAALGPAHEEVAETLTALADLSLRQGRHEEAETMARESLAIRRQRYAQGDAQIGAGEVALATVLFDRGKYDEAAAAADQALALQRKALGEGSREVGQTLQLAGNIAGQGKGDWKRAAPMIEQSLAIRRAALGPDHPDVALALNDLAIANLNLNQLDSAERLYKEALAVTRRAYGEEHPEVAIVMENLGGVYFRNARYKETQAVLGEVLAMRRKVLGENHPAVTRTMLNTATVAMRAGDPRAADAAYENAVPRIRKELGNDHPDVATTLCNWSMTTAILKDWPRTEKLARECLDIRQRVKKDDRAAIGESQVALGRALAEQGRRAEGEPLLTAGRAAILGTGDAANRWVGYADEELRKLAAAASPR